MSKKKKTKKNASKNKDKIANKQPKNTSSTKVQTLDTTKKNKVDIYALFLSFLAIILYLNTLGHQYAFDDSIVITNNSFTLEGLAGIYDLMTRDFFEGIYGEQGMNLSGGRYRPLSLVMFAVEEHFFPGNAAVGHFVNVLMYALTAFFMFKMLKNWLSEHKHGLFIAFVCCLLFVVHPTHTEVVANIKSRDEIMALLFLMLSLNALFNNTISNNSKHLVVAPLCFFLAMMSKENAFTYSIAFPLFLFIFKQYSLSESIKKCLPFFGIALFYIGLRSFMLYKAPMAGVPVPQVNQDIMENPFVHADTVSWLATIGLILWKYLGLMLLPLSLSSDYSFNQIPLTNFADPMAVLGWLFYLAIGVYAAVKIWKKDQIALSILLYLAPLSLVINLLFNIGAPMADRFLYAPSFGFCLAIALLAAKLLPLKEVGLLQQHKGILLSLLIIGLLFAILTIQRNPVWKNNYTLFANDVQVAENSAKMQYYFANTLLKKYLDKGEAHMRQPDAADLALLDSAEVHFTKSYDINPKFHHSTYNLGLVNIYKKQAQKALDWLNYTLQLQPNHGITHEQLVRVYGEFLNQPDKALEHLNIALSTAEGQKNASNYQYLGNIMAMKGNFEAAENAFIKAATMRPSIAKSCYQNLAGMFGNLAAQAQASGNIDLYNQYLQKSNQYKQQSNNY